MTRQQRHGGRSNARVAVVLGGIVAGMTGLTFAAVPLYDLFCRVTGFAGTPQVADGIAGPVLDRKITIRFNADVNRDLKWSFRPEANTMDVRVGEPALTSYHARNNTDAALVGTATYNVTPEKAGIYFNKIQCFCFTEQMLEPGQSVDMPVYFFVDPAIAEDPHMDDVTTITLSYTFYKAPDQTLAHQAMDGEGARDYQESAQAAPPAVAGTPAERLN
ncbi:cytochrome c oxidase assembly protein [Indioceanicola profundi]|uniref:cytochrome c oxidase assembly protein n=1 Tax=Indioceanicola profundi TaxID=2220096 RepID=UPI000E6AC4F0|nr:cytochrome c oxidase assembly protein [Indioceanicola profundi]